MNRTNLTVGKLLEELKKNIPALKVGMFFETIKSIYPDDTIDKKNKNIINENNVIFTKPYALSRKEKIEILKEKSPLDEFIKERKRGDYLKIVKKENNIYYCKNISIHEEIIEKYYKDELVKITEKDIIDGVVKPIIRIRDSYLYNYMEEYNGN